MTTVGTGKHSYTLVENWARLPRGMEFGPVSAVAVDSRDRVYAFQRKDPPVLVFDREGTLLTSWGSGAITDPHGFSIGPDDLVYLTDRDDHVALKFTLDGKPLAVLGRRGHPSDTGCTQDGGAVLRAGGPFNKPTELVPSPSGDLYVSDGYRNCRVHRYSTDGVLQQSWGSPGKTAPGEFHLPHSLWVDRQGLVYVCDRENSRIQIFSPTGQFLRQWTNVHRPTDIYMDADEVVYISELRPSISVLDKQGGLLARWDSPSAHGLFGDSHGALYLAEVQGRKVTKYARR